MALPLVCVALDAVLVSFWEEMDDCDKCWVSPDAHGDPTATSSWTVFVVAPWDTCCCASLCLISAVEVSVLVCVVDDESFAILLLSSAFSWTGSVVLLSFFI